MWKSSVKVLITAASAVLSLQAHATGIFTPSRWLDNGGIASDMSPEFFWELEVKRMAQEYKPAEKRVLPEDKKPAPGDPPEKDSAFEDNMDLKEFDAALKTGQIKPADAAKATEQHKTAREKVSAATEATKDPLPEEFASEFADYHRGAYAYRLGVEHYQEARTAWEALLKRPKEERHYRSVWAAFMLGKLALEEDKPEAAQWFQMARELAKDGFADSIGLAADSYGWEAKSALEQGHMETAAKLYLTQLALGDESAVISLKAVIPDRGVVEGMMNFEDGPPEGASPADLQKWEDERAPRLQKRFEEIVRSPILRRLETAHVLATETQAEVWMYGENQEPSKRDRCLKWLAVMEKTGLKKVDDADHLGWVAYAGGRYDEAARWLKMADAATGSSLWLQAKLQRRAGKIQEAAETMAKALKLVKADYANLLAKEDEDRGVFYSSFTPDTSAAGDLAALHLTRGEFVNAMDAFLQGGLWTDAAFVGDRVLTVDELKKYVDAHYAEPAPEKENAQNSSNGRIRWMLARRLVREDRYDEAKAYFPAQYVPVLTKYVAALKDADNAKLPKLQRARAWFNAAWIARYDGMELMGTEVEPDGFVDRGEFPPGNLDTERKDEAKVTTEYDDKKKEEVLVKTPVKLSIPATPEEKKRIAKSTPLHGTRYHYRHVAAVLAWKAAALMNDGTEELADVLNMGGSWIKNDEKAADKYFQAIERRCGKTEIGKAASAKHWFTGTADGPWSAPLEAARAAAESR